MHSGVYLYIGMYVYVFVITNVYLYVYITDGGINDSSITNRTKENLQSNRGAQELIVGNDRKPSITSYSNPGMYLCCSEHVKVYMLTTKAENVTRISIWHLEKLQSFIAYS